MMQPSSDGRMMVVTGASRSGKTAGTMQLVADLARLLVWDPDDEWHNARCVRVDDPLALIKKLFETVRHGSGRVCYVPDRLSRFDWFCRVAFNWGALGWVREVPTSVVIDELASVTGTAKAGGAYGEFVRRILKKRTSLYGITQRPAECDKTIMANLSAIRCYRMQKASDREYMAREMDGPSVEEIATLQPLEYFETWPGIPERAGYKRGKTTF